MSYLLMNFYPLFFNINDRFQLSLYLEDISLKKGNVFLNLSKASMVNLILIYKS